MNPLAEWRGSPGAVLLAASPGAYNLLHQRAYAKRELTETGKRDKALTMKKSKTDDTRGLAPRPYLREVVLQRSEITCWDDYPFSVPSVQYLNRLNLHRDVTFLVGENGTGKSTLLESIAVVLGLNAEGGTKNTRFATRETHSKLDQYLRIVRSYKRPKQMFFLRAESFYNVASYIDDVASDIIEIYGGRSLHAQSHGESFMAVLKNRLTGQGLYLLDEPEAALSPNRQLQVLRIIHDLVKKDSQFIIATHSPILMGYPSSIIYNMSESGIAEVNYLETEHYLVTRGFLNHYESSIREITREDDQD